MVEFLNEENMGTFASTKARHVLNDRDQATISRHAIHFRTLGAVIAFAWSIGKFKVDDGPYPIHGDEHGLIVLLILLEVVNLGLEFFERGDDFCFGAVLHDFGVGDAEDCVHGANSGLDIFGGYLCQGGYFITIVISGLVVGAVVNGQAEFVLRRYVVAVKELHLLDRVRCCQLKVTV